MLLRHLFEASNSEVAIIFGRFNPPHKGHRAAWEMASQSSVWFVGTNQSTVGPKDPLPFDVKVEAMKTVWPEVEGHIMAETSWLTMASEVYKKYPKATLLCLTDEDWVTKTIVQYNGKEGPHGFYNFRNIEQKPTPRLSSATALRDAVTKGDREAFAQAAGVPSDTEVAGKPFFDLVAKFLLPYANAPKKAPAKKKKEPAVAEMDSQGYTGSRDRKSASKYGSRDDYELGKGKEGTGKPLTAKQMMDKAHKAMMKSMSNDEKVDKGWRNPNLKEYGDTAKGQKMLTKVQKRAVDRVTSKKADTDPKYAKKNKDTADRAWDRMDTSEDTSKAMAQTAKRLTDPKDGATAKLRAAGDKRREDQLKGRDIAKRNESVDLKINLQELSNDMLGKYKKAASADASKADKAGDFKRGDKRFSGIVKATKKQFDNDAKKK